jgi:hypothetical protein
VLTISFLVTAPIIVLQAKGYRFDMKRGVFVYSGAITFKTNPQSVNIKLNQQQTSSQKLNMLNGSYSLTNLMPGHYNLQISAPGFQTWKKRITVHSGIANEFWNVLLARNHYTENNLKTPNIDRFFISPKNKFLVYDTNSNQELNIKILNIDSQKEIAQFKFLDWNFNGKVIKENIEWSPDENYLSIPVKKISLQKTSSAQSENEKNYFVVDLKQKKIFDLKKIFHKKDISHVRWDPIKKKYLFFLAKNILYKANIQKPNSLTVIADQVSSYDLSKAGIYYIQNPNNLVFRIDLDGKSNVVQITNNFPTNRKKSTIDKLIVYNELKIAILTKDKTLFIYNRTGSKDYFNKIGTNINSFQFSDDGKKLLFWSDNEIKVYYLEDWNVQPIRHKNEIQDITRYASKLSNVQWFKDYEHIIFSIGSQLKIIELDPRGHNNCMNLLTIQSKQPFVIYNGYLNKLYFTSKINSTSNLYFIKFPEKTSFLRIPGLNG